MSHQWWIPVPGGRRRRPGATASEDVEGILRVLIVPVLDEPLVDAGLSDWPPPGLTSATPLSVTATPDAGGTPVTLTASPHLDVVDGAWQEFFDGMGVVSPRGLPGREILVDPTGDRVDRVTTAYATAARALFAEEARPEFHAAVTAAAVEVETATREESARITAELESLRDSARTRTRAEGNRNGTSREGVDFNLAIGLLREHPAVLECLGLILTLRLTKDDLGRLPEAGTLGVTWPDAPTAGLPEIRYRRTAYTRGPFLPRPKPGSLIAPGGMVALAGTGWRLHTIDPDLAIAGLAAVAVEAEQGVASEPGLPAIKTSGILLAQTGRKSALSAQATPAEPQDTLFADDLVLGYRIDARDTGSGVWRSLMSRTGRYKVNGLDLTTSTEEGHVKIGGGTDDGDEILRTSEVVARWDGWSLAVPRPRLGIGPQHGPTTDPPSYHLEVPDRPTPGSLPRLEFGRSYQVRARVADLAGGGPGLEASSPDRCDSAVVTFARLEPLLPPEVRLPAGVTAEFGPGANADTLVIRAPEGAVRAPAPSDPRVPDPDTSRELRPPRGTFDLVERHHRLAGDPQATRPLVTREHLPDPAAGGVAAFIGRVPGEAPADLEFREWVPGDDAADAWPELPPKRLVLLPREDKAEPTLVFADARLLVVRLDPAEEATLEISSTIHDKERSSFLVSTWVGVPRRPVPEPEDAGDARVERAEPVTRPDSRTEPEIASAELLLGQGRHPMATPPHLIRVRHAVRLPRGTPAGALVPRRPVDATYVELRPDTPLGAQNQPPPPVRNPGRRRDPEPRDLVGVDPASTAAVEVAASWAPVEDLDDPATSGRHVGRVEVTRGARVLPPIRHEVGDTKHRQVTYTLTAVSRFRDCYPDAETAPDSAFTTVGEIGPISVPSSARPPAPVVRAAVPGFVHRDTGASGPGEGTVVRTRLGNRVRLELAPPWYATGDGERLVVLHRGSSTGDDGRFTQAGRDPIWSTGDMERFPVATGQEVDVVLQHLGTVKGVPHTAWRAGDSWWVDVAYPSIPSYGALVQLAVVRWQPHSLLSPDNLTTSSIVRTDWVPLLPERTLTVRREGDQIVVVLSGLGPVAPANRVDVLVELPVEALTDSQVGVVAGDDGLWVTEASESGALDREIRVTVRGSGNRVRVREVEQIPQFGTTGLGTLGELSERVVFTDTVLV